MHVLQLYYVIAFFKVIFSINFVVVVIVNVSLVTFHGVEIHGNGAESSKCMVTAVFKSKMILPYPRSSSAALFLSLFFKGMS